MTTDPKFDNEQMMAVDAGYWACQWPIRLQAGPFSFVDHEYQMEPMTSRVQRKCVMKGTQGGFTENEVLDSLHGMRYKLLPQGVLYLFPTTDDVGEFSKSRFNPLILANPSAIGKFVKNQGKGTDTVSLKKIHDAFLYLRGARLSQKISDINESSKLRSIPVDRVVFDEVDLMDDAVIGKARARMGHSLIQQERYLSNPIIPGEGIDKIFSKSDQRHLFRECSCSGIISTPAATTVRGNWTCAELSFPGCVKVGPDGKGYIGCTKCGKAVPFNRGATIEWVPAKRENSEYMHGYQWSQLTSVFHDPYDILCEYNDPPEGNLADIIRLKLGLPYIAEEDRLTRAQVYNCCGNYQARPKHSGPCAMGVDVGKIKHVVIGPRTGKDQYELVKTARLSEWNDILDMAVKLHVKVGVVDIRPYEDSAREFQKKAKKIGIKIYLCEYKENTPQGTIYNDNTGIVSVNRTEIFDATHRMITTPGMLTIPRFCPEIEEFAKQMCGAYKVLETNKKTGISVYRYKGQDEHFRNALNYFTLASKGGKIAQTNTSTGKRQTVTNNVG